MGLPVAARYSSNVVRPSDATQDQIQARHIAAHNLSSPIRGVAILADVLVETLDNAEPDIDLVRDLVGQVVSLAEEATTRLAAFATELDD